MSVFYRFFFWLFADYRCKTVCPNVTIVFRKLMSTVHDYD